MTALMSNVIQLDWADEGGVITVTPKDQSRFNIKLRKAVEVLQHADRIEQFQQQFNLLLDVLAKWLRKQEGIATAFLTLRDGGLGFIVVREASEYDDTFEDSLSDLDFQIANDIDLDMISLDTITLPNASEEAMRSFLDPGFVISYVKDGSRQRPHSVSQ